MTQNHVWVVTLHYNRGNVEVFEYTSKKEAIKLIDVTVFKNEDCINCSIYKKFIK
jgi:hypothetical protein